MCNEIETFVVGCEYGAVGVVSGKDIQRGAVTEETPVITPSLKPNLYK